jgi:hypothetical protein
MQLRACLFALAQSVCDKEVSRVKLLCNARQGQPKGGNCWRDAFGDILEVDLSHLSTKIKIPPNLCGVASLQGSSGVGFGDLQVSWVFTALEDFVISLGIHSLTTVKDVVFLQGANGICALIGFVGIPPLPLWHVCSIEEASFLKAYPDKFLDFVEKSRSDLGCIEDKRNHRKHYLEWKDLKEIILVGALISPQWCTIVDTKGPFIAPSGIPSGRMNTDNLGSKLQWERINGQAQFSMGAQGPQGTLSIGEEASKGQGLQITMAEISLSNNTTILERALRTWVLVYSASSGQIAEQNLYCLANCLLKVGVPLLRQQRLT